MIEKDIMHLRKKTLQKIGLLIVGPRPNIEGSSSVELQERYTET